MILFKTPFHKTLLKSESVIYGREETSVTAVSKACFMAAVSPRATFVSLAAERFGTLGLRGAMDCRLIARAMRNAKNGVRSCDDRSRVRSFVWIGRHESAVGRFSSRCLSTTRQSEARLRKYRFRAQAPAFSSAQCDERTYTLLSTPTDLLCVSNGSMMIFSIRRWNVSSRSTAQRR